MPDNRLKKPRPVTNSKWGKIPSKIPPTWQIVSKPYAVESGTMFIVRQPFKGNGQVFSILTYDASSDKLLNLWPKGSPHPVTFAKLDTAKRMADLYHTWLLDPAKTEAALKGETPGV